VPKKSSKPKRKYTFRKNKIVSYESGSVLHELEKSDRAIKKKVKKVYGF
jgi:hypothetical protein